MLIHEGCTVIWSLLHPKGAFGKNILNQPDHHDYRAEMWGRLHVLLLNLLFPGSLRSPLQMLCLDKHTCTFSNRKPHSYEGTELKHRDTSGWEIPELVSKELTQSRSSRVLPQLGCLLWGNSTQRDALGQRQRWKAGNSPGIWSLKMMVESEMAF